MSLQRPVMRLSSNFRSIQIPENCNTREFSRVLFYIRNLVILKKKNHSILRILSDCAAIEHEIANCGGTLCATKQKLLKITKECLRLERKKV